MWGELGHKDHVGLHRNDAGLMQGRSQGNVAKLGSNLYRVMQLSKGQGHALTAVLRRLGIHIMALQECRKNVDAIRFHDGICKLAGPACAGQFGCQIWIDCSRSLQAVGHEGSVMWNRTAFNILYKDHRILVVGAQAGATRFAIVPAHACTTVASEEEREHFGARLRHAMNAVPRGFIPLMMLDANARFKHGTTEPASGCGNAARLRELAQCHDMWLSGNVDKHGRALVTWVPPGCTQGGSCLDYVAIPRAWSRGAEVVGHPRLLDVHAGHDHFPVAVDLRACLLGRREDRRVDIDVEQLFSPLGQAKAEMIFAHVPCVPWYVDVDYHLRVVNQYLATAFSALFLERADHAILLCRRCPCGLLRKKGRLGVSLHGVDVLRENCCCMLVSGLGGVSKSDLADAVMLPCTDPGVRAFS